MGTLVEPPEVSVSRKMAAMRARRAQTVIVAAWAPLLAAGLLALYAPSSLVFALAAVVFAGTAIVQVAASVTVVRARHSG
jgi:hypothetical protein